MNCNSIRKTVYKLPCVIAFLAAVVIAPFWANVSADSSEFSEELWSNGAYSSTLGDMAGRRLYVYGLADSLGDGPLPKTDSEINMQSYRPAGRLECAQILYRICAFPEEESEYSCPFSDVPEQYAEAVAWLYTNGITNGVSDELFGTGTLSRNQFLTMLSRLLGWEIEAENGWNGNDCDELLILASQNSLIPLGLSANRFTRGDMYLLLLELALNCYPEKCVPVRAEVSRPKTVMLSADSIASAEEQMLFAVQFAPREIDVCFTQDLSEEDLLRFRYLYREDGEESIARKTFIPYLNTGSANNYAFSQWDERTFVFEFRNYAPAHLAYVDSLDWLRCYEDERYCQRIRQFYIDYIIPLCLDGDDELTLVKKAQDLVCRIAAYDYMEYNAIKWHQGSSNPVTHQISGFLRSGKIVCDGYAKSFQWVLRCMGIDSFVVYGISGYANDYHAWNKVKVDGEWYNADVCWKDTGEGATYFLKSDSLFGEHMHLFQDEYVLTDFYSNRNCCA